MPIVSFSILGLGGLLLYSGYLGYSPATIVKAALDGKLSTLGKIPIDPRKRNAPRKTGQVLPKPNNSSGGTVT